MIVAYASVCFWHTSVFFYHMHMRMSKTWKKKKSPQKLDFIVQHHLKTWFDHFSLSEQGSNNVFCSGWSVIFQQFAAGQYTVTSELGLQWVISPWRCVFVCFRRSSIMTHLPLNAVAVSSHQQNPWPHRGLASQSVSFLFTNPGISYLIGHWWVALFLGMLMTVGWSGFC